MVDIEQFIIQDEALEKIHDEAYMMKHLDAGTPLQDLLGFTDEATLEFYETAKNILEQKRYEDAMNAFSFLTAINPYMSDFWLGLGMSQQQKSQYEDALSSYNIATSLEGSKIFPYLIAAHCCMEIKDFDKALDIIGEADKYAQEHNEETDSEQLKKDAQAAREYILEQKKAD